MANGSMRTLAAPTRSAVMQAFKVLDVGTVVVNHSTAIRLENLPFGGTKQSGNAREGLHETLLEMTEEKTLLMAGVLAA